MKNVWFVLSFVLPLFLLMPLAAQYTKTQGFSQDGNKSVTTQGLSSTTKVQQSFPGATVTVFDQGTTTPSTIYSDSTGTAKGNPFTLNSTADGQWSFYGTPNKHYDVQFSGGGIASPFTITDYVAPSILSGTANYIPVFTAAGTLGNSAFYNNNGQLLFNGISTDVTGTNITTLGNNTGFIACGATSNATCLSMTINNSSGALISSTKTASGSYGPMSFATNGSTQVTYGVNGGVAIGSPTGGALSTGQLNLAGALYENNTAVISSGGDLTGLTYKTQTNCASSGGTCSSAPAGSVSIAASATTVTVATTAVAANSDILVTFDESLGTKLGVTCNTAGASEGAHYFVSARSSGTSFTIKTSVAPTTNPACLNYFIIN